eukprot:4852841-Prymnesium_polylepis.3
MNVFISTPWACHVPGLPEERWCPMSREPALEVGECPLTRHRPQVRRVWHAPTHTTYTDTVREAEDKRDVVSLRVRNPFGAPIK